MSNFYQESERKAWQQAGKERLRADKNESLLKAACEDTQRWKAHAERLAERLTVTQGWLIECLERTISSTHHYAFSNAIKLNRDVLRDHEQMKGE